MTARQVLVAQLWREYRELRQKDFMASLAAVVDRKLHVANPRIEQLREWLMNNPPAGSPYRCKECLHGTHSEDRLCAACWAF